MEHPDTPSTPVVAPAPDEMHDDLRSLRSTSIAILFALACMGLALGYLLYRQVADSNRRVVEAKRFVNEFQTNGFPKIAWFVDNLRGFARTNADFNPILTKYSAFIEDVDRNKAPQPAVSPPVIPPKSGAPPPQATPPKK